MEYHLKLTPRPSGSNVVDGAFADVKALRQDARSYEGATPNLVHSARAQLRQAMARSVGTITTALRQAVPDVGELGSKEKVAWVEAQRNVASMQNEQALWNQPVCESPRNPMRQIKVRDSVLVIHPETTVRATACACPPPAFVRPTNIDVRPKPREPFFGSKLSSSHSILRDRVVRGRSGLISPPVPIILSRWVFA